MEESLNIRVRLDIYYDYCKAVFYYENTAQEFVSDGDNMRR